MQVNQRSVLGHRVWAWRNTGFTPLANPDTPPYLGEIREVNAEKGAVRFRHGPVTCPRHVHDDGDCLFSNKGVPTGPYVDEKVQFTAELPDGAFVLTKI